MNEEQKRAAYWKANLRLVGLCLSIWFVVSFLFGIILVEQLNTISTAGNGAEFVAVDRAGNMYGGEPAPRNLQKYVRVRP